MRFLCLHGLGANADIFETQTKLLRDELGYNHDFEFLDGDQETAPAPGLGSIFPGPYFSWYPLPDTATNIQQGVDSLKEYIAENGPYDGAIAFSQGAQVLMGLMLEHQLQHPFEPALIQVAIFLSGVMSKEQKQLVAKGVKIRVPTTHILGGKRDWQYEESLEMRDACNRNTRTEYEHDEGHCIPRKRENVVAIANAVGKSVYRASYGGQ